MSSELEKNKLGDIKSYLKTYFKGVKSEWGKITWPVKQQVVAETGVVIFIVTIFTTFVYLIDILFKWVFKFLH